MNSKLSRKHDTIDVTQQCSKAFFQFKLEYRKNYTQQEEELALKNFCVNLERLKQLRLENGTTEYGLNAYSDRSSMPLSYVPHNFSTKHQHQEEYIEMPKLGFSAAFPDSSYTNTNQDVTNYNRAKSIPLICSSSSSPGGSSNVISSAHFEALFPTTFPNSIDLREWGIVHRAIDQGSCGSCWAQSARYVLTGSVVRDLPFYKQLYPVAFANVTNSNFRLSVQMIMNDSFGSNKYCAGGNFISAAIDSAYQHVPSQDFESAVPYLSMMNSDAELTTPPTVIQPKTAEFKTNPLNPTHWFNPNSGSCPSVLIQIEASDQLKGFNDDEIEKIKRVLTLGVPLSGHMIVDTDAAGMKFQLYSGGIAHGSCETYSSNHQVTLVGYGHYKTVPVWLFMNSWGSSWGQSGYYMIQQKENAFCSETEVVGILPRYYGFLENKPEIFNESTTYLNNKAMYNNSLYISVRRGANGMDNYDSVTGLPIEEYRKLPGTKWILVVVLLIVGGFLVFAIIRCVFYPPAKKIPMPMYIEFTEEEADKQNWAKAAGVVGRHKIDRVAVTGDDDM
ncbi:Papain_family cysteine protease [Hexamita inflata]|uniref:Papain family cysteine protease n=1 Tax=Hexamita inflata TaxID=28002 RepID=A0AA86UZU1_9EUKA|nr:Papain family cysteine protease [Hexamita inflata]